MKQLKLYCWGLSKIKGPFAMALAHSEREAERIILDQASGAEVKAKLTALLFFSDPPEVHGSPWGVHFL